MLNLTENSKRIGFLKGKAAQAAGNYFARLERYEIAREEYQQALAAYELVNQTFPDFTEAQDNKKTVQTRLGELPIQQHHPTNHPTKNKPDQSLMLCDPLFVLGQWLQNKFDKAIRAGWLTPAEIFGPKHFAFRKNQTVKRAKKIKLGTDKVALVIELDKPSKNPEFKVIIRVCPIGEQIYLPEDLKFTIIPEKGEPDEYLTENHNHGFETERFYKHGERFTVKVQLNDMMVTEDFVI